MVDQEYLEPKIELFFHNKNIKEYENLNYDFSDIEFKNTEVLPFDVFYTYFFNDIHRKDKANSSSKIIYTIKYLLTFDKENCPILCENTKIFYDVVYLNEESCFYFIHINLVDVFCFLRSNDKQEKLL